MVTLACAGQLPKQPHTEDTGKSEKAFSYLEDAAQHD
jgi:hypothetical protein